ncbi:MAG: SMC-Scp complex subunit ScpB, partial [Clostridia bacterium]
PVSIERLSAVLEIELETIERIAENLRDYYNFEQRGIRLVRLENTLQLCTSPRFGGEIRAVMETRRAATLSAPLLEVLSIIAYRQPVTRAYIEQVRGVDSSYSVTALLEKGLIAESGRLDVPGRPALFKTTKDFLRVFGLSSIKELPELPEFSDDGSEQLSFLKTAAEDASQ